MLMLAAVQSYNRFETLRLTLHFLMHSNRDKLHIAVFDDGSTDERVWPYLQHLVMTGKIQYAFQTDNHEPFQTDKANERCGALRKKIVDFVLTKQPQGFKRVLIHTDYKAIKTYETLTMLDDDVIVGKETLQQLKDELRIFQLIPKEQLPEGKRPVAISPYSMAKFFYDKPFEVLGRVFHKTRLTGEALTAWFVPALRRIGNHYGPHKYGYCDTQWNAMHEAGCCRVVRVRPYYEAQHIGLGVGGSTIYKGDKLPKWVVTPWMKNNQVPYSVENFELAEFMDNIVKLGYDKGCERYYEILMSRMSGKEVIMRQANQRSVEVNQYQMKGHLKVLVREKTKNGTIVKEHDMGENIIVNNFYDQVARLLAGDSQSDRAIAQMEFGVGTTAAKAADVALASPITPVKDIASYAYPESGAVRFTAYLLADEANGFPITEAGLLTNNTSPKLMTRRVFAALNKSSDFVFEFQWTIAKA